jgi:hypothetical protein
VTEVAKDPKIKPVNGTLKYILGILSGVAVLIISTAIIGMWMHTSDNDKHFKPEPETTKLNRIRVTVRDMVEVPPREITQRLDRLEAGLSEMKAMVRDLLVAMVAKGSDNHKNNKGD